MFPPLPLDPQDLCQLIPDSPFVHLYRINVCSEGSLASDFMLQKMKDVEQIQFDRTSYTAFDYYQLLQYSLRFMDIAFQL